MQADDVLRDAVTDRETAADYSARQFLQRP